MSANALQQIRTLLGPSGMIDDPQQMQPYLTSWRNSWEGRTPFIALPADTKQLGALVEICHHHHIAIVPQGGNTGLVGGGIPSTEGDQLVVSLSRMNKIRAIDQVGAIATIESGVILQTLQDEADKAGFLFPLSMASEGSAQIGGAISTNAGGTAVLRYGNMRQLVLGIEAVMPDGTIVSELKSLPKDNTGYNISQYFIGAEGTLGIITAATIRLFPKQNQVVTGIASVPDAAAAMELLSQFRAECGEHLNAFEIISNAALRAVIEHIPGTRFPCNDGSLYYVLIELGSSSAAMPLRSLFESAASQAIESGKATDVVIAENMAQAKQFWALRENISESLRHKGNGLHFDISVPLASISKFLGTIDGRVTAIAPGVYIAPFGHIGDGNIHYNMCLLQGADVGLKARIRDLVYGEVTRLGGSISAEHGIGIERKAELLHYKSHAALAIMKGVKQALDPQGIMNPGKIFDQ